jgi:hypothetical protein
VYFWNLDDGFAGVVLLKKGNAWVFDFRRYGTLLIFGHSRDTIRQK